MMTSIFKLVGANVVLVAIYYLAAQFTLSLSLPPTGVTPLWVPTGLSLGAVLVWGYRLLPAVFLGDFIVGYQMLSFSSTMDVLLCVLIGLQAVFHPWFATWLLRRYHNWPDTLIDDIKIAKFYIISVLTLIPPTLLFIIGEFYLGVIERQDVLRTFFLWWAGGAIGTIIFTPIVLALFMTPRHVWQKRIVGFAIPMSVLFVLSVAGLHLARHSDVERLHNDFETQVKFADKALQEELEGHRELLMLMHAYFQYSEYVSEQEFLAFSREFPRDHDDLYAVAWIEYVAGKDRLHDEQQPVIAPNQKNDAVVKYLSFLHTQASLNHQKKIYGYEVCSAPHQRPVCDYMNTSLKPAIMPLWDDASNSDLANEFVYLMPVINKQDKLSGFVAQLFDQRMLFERLFDIEHKKWLNITLRDTLTQEVLYSNLTTDNQAAVFSDGTVIDKTIRFGHRDWHIEYRPSDEFYSENSTWTIYWLVTGILIGLSMLGIGLMAITGKVLFIRDQVRSKTLDIIETSALLEDSERQYRHLVENIEDEYFLYQCNVDGHYTYISSSIVNILGYSQADFMAHYIDYIVIKDASTEDSRKSRIQQTLLGKPTSYDIEIVDKSGKIHIFKVKETPTVDSSGNIIGVEGIAHDLTALKQSQRELEKLSLAIKHSPSAVVITDNKGTIEYVNPKFTVVTGFRVDEAIGQWPNIVSSGLTPPSVYKHLWDTVLSGREWRGELQNRKKNGDLYWAQEFIAPVIDENGKVTHFVITQEDITEARRITEQTTYQASHDTLTGLINRREFETRLSRVINSAKDNLTENALCFLDLDKFKVVNDTCGHVAGDELLRQIGALMQANIRSRDTLARLGGDEFAILMEKCGIEQAHQACEKIIELFKEFRFHWDEHTFVIGVSIGLTIVDHQTIDIHQVMKDVDSACYQAKDAGRNCVQVHSEDNERLNHRKGQIQWRNEINDALADDRFLLYVQPIVPTDSSDPYSSYEVLLRMQMSDGTIALPGAFLPAAERYNSATKIDRWAVGQTFKWIRRHINDLSHIAMFSINLSGQSIGDDALLGFIIREIERGDVPGRMIRFEITETVAIANLRDATVFIKTLAEQGCHFALDDFGSGLSSFAYLKNLHIDAIKIDGVFVKDMMTDPLDFEMVKAINDIGHVMGLETVAEFVEHPEVMDKLRSIGVDYAQGHYLGSPVPIDTILLNSI